MTGVTKTRTRRAGSGLLAGLALALLLTGCDAPPSADQIKIDVAATLGATTQTGLLTPDAVEVLDASSIGGTVHFAVDLKLERDHAFASWDQMSLSALAHALGAAPSAIEGINVHGNMAGDHIKITSRARYIHDRRRSGWTLEQFGPPPMPSGAPIRGLRDDVWGVITAVVAAPQTWRIIRDNFVWAFSRSSTQLARSRGGFSIISGATGTDGWSIVEALREQQSTQHPIVNLTAINDAAMVRLIRDGDATAAIVDSDRAPALFEAMPELRALAALFPRQLHILVRQDSSIASIVDLRGKRIVAANAPSHAGEDALKAYRISASTAKLAAMPLADGIAALNKSEVDAVIVTARAPDPDITAVASTGAVRLLGLDGDAIALLTTAENRYLAINIPARTYPNQPNPITTVAVVAMLIAPAATPDTEVAGLLGQVFGPVDYLQNGSVAGMFINRDTSLRGITVPMHPAATAFLESPAVDIPSKEGVPRNGQTPR